MNAWGFVFFFFCYIVLFLAFMALTSRLSTYGWRANNVEHYQLRDASKYVVTFLKDLPDTSTQSNAIGDV